MATVLEANHFFNALGAASQKRLSACAQRKTYPDGGSIFNEGDPPDFLYIVRSGKVEIVKAAGPGQSVVLSTLKPGDYFGEIAVLGSEGRTTGARASGPVTLDRLPAAEVRATLAQEPPQVILRLLERIIGYLRETNQRYLDEAVHMRELGMRRDQLERMVEERTAELRHSNSLLSATLESATDGLLVVNLEGKIVAFNKKFVTMWGIPDYVIESRDDDQSILSVLNQLKNPETFLMQVRELYAKPDAESFDILEFKDGRVFERYSLPQKIDGKSVGRVWSFRDVTERKRLEAQFLQSQKMEAVGQLAGGLAHDFNNLLTAITGSAELMSEQLKPEDPLRADIEEIQKASQRAALLTRQLLLFSRKQIVQPRPLDLNYVVSDLEKMLRRLIGENIELVTRLDPDLWEALADSGHMEQVVMNLVVNARDAIKDGGAITIETANVDLTEEEARRQGTSIRGPHVMLSVTDTGCGMDEKTLSHVFEPFFTTKEPGKGTGLGLSTVYGIVKQSGGHISLASAVGRGTTLRVYLPRAQSSEAASKKSSIAFPSTLRGTETVLVVEDEPLVRDLVQRVLESYGYTVLEVPNPESALEACRLRQEPFELLLTDVVLPQMNGGDLAEKIVSLYPGTKVLFMSGYTDASILRHQVMGKEMRLVRKPFKPELLARAVREVLDT